MIKATWVRRQSLRIALAIMHLALLVVAAWLVAVQIASGPIQVFAIGLLGVIAALVVLAPGSAAALTFIVGSGVLYLVLSSLESAVGVDGRTPVPLHVLGLAAALFLVHAVDSLREVLPSDAGIDPAVLARWVRRVGEAAGPGLVLAGALVLLPSTEHRTWLWVVGAIGLLLAVGLPAAALRPRPWADRLTVRAAEGQAEQGRATVEG